MSKTNRGGYQNKNLFTKIISVDLDKVLLIFGHIFFRENGFYWADRAASTTVNALIGIDVVLVGIVIRVNTIHRTDFHTSGVLGIYTGGRNNVCHSVISSFFYDGMHFLLIAIIDFKRCLFLERPF